MNLGRRKAGEIRRDGVLYSTTFNMINVADFSSSKTLALSRRVSLGFYFFIATHSCNVVSLSVSGVFFCKKIIAVPVCILCSQRISFSAPRPNGPNLEPEHIGA